MKKTSTLYNGSFMEKFQCFIKKIITLTFFGTTLDL
jgi:hypothetical protein